MCYDEARHLHINSSHFTCGLYNVNTRSQTQCEGRSGLSEHLEVSFEMEDHRGERMTTKLPNILVPNFESLIFADRTCSIDKDEKNVQTMEVHTKSKVDVDADKGNFG